MKKLTYEYVKKQIKKEGYELLSEEYLGARTKLKILCNKGHTYKVVWYSFKQGHRCPYCTGVKKLTYKYIKKQIKKEGYRLLSKNYINSCTKLKIQCPTGHIYKVNWCDFQQGIRCPDCAIINNQGKNNSSWKGGPIVAWYTTYAYRLDFCEEVRRNPKNNDLLQVKCTNSNCRKWFTPSRNEVKNRIQAVNIINNIENRFYCSDECKHSCSLYRQIKYPKGFKPSNKGRDPVIQKDWATMVKERDKYTCQRCGSKDNLIAHHFEGIECNPIMSADVDMGITLCDKCNKKAHSEVGCRPVDMRKRVCLK